MTFNTYLLDMGWHSMNNILLCLGININNLLNNSSFAHVPYSHIQNKYNTSLSRDLTKRKQQMLVF